MIKLNGAPAYGATAGAISAFTDPLLTLVTGHTYRFKMHRISGSFTGDELYAAAVMYGGYYNRGTRTESGDDYWTDFVPPAEGVQLGFKVTRKESVATLTNLVLLCTLEDLTVGGDSARAASVAPVQSDTASTNIAAGELLMRDGTLYKATQAIVAGAAIDSTNVTVTTIAAQLAALEARIAALES